MQRILQDFRARTNDMNSRAPIVVVGGGTAGCTVVSHLAANTTRDIVLIEPGGIVTTDENSHFYEALSNEAATRQRVVHISHDRKGIYREARALGGGSAVNGMLLTGDEPDHLRGLTRMATGADCGAMGEMLLNAGGEFSRLWWNRGRWNPGRAVDHLVEEGRVRIVASECEEILFRHQKVRSVRTWHDEIEASHVVLCAGAIATPDILLRSGCADINPSIGVGLQNHPVINVPFVLDQPSQARFDASVVFHSDVSPSGAITVFAFERASHTENQLGLIAIALMNPESTGTVSRVGDTCDVDFNVLSTSRDVQSLVDGVELFAEILDNCPVSGGVHLAKPASTDFSLDGFQSSSDDARRELVLNHVDVLSHATSSCSLSVDRNGGLQGFEGLTLADASVLRCVPNCTPAAPVTMEALRIARILGEELS